MLKFLNKILAFYRFSKVGYLKDIDWFNSYYSKSSTINNQEVPLITYPAIYYLDLLNMKSFNVLEFGSGNSTIWFRKKGCTVYSIETDKLWFKKVSENSVIENEKYFHVSLDDYFSPIENLGLKDFDVVLIDGKRSNECIELAIDLITKTGVIILDNSDREINQVGVKFLKDNRFKELPFYGLSPSTIYSSKTSIFYRNNNCFEI